MKPLEICYRWTSASFGVWGNWSGLGWSPCETGCPLSHSATWAYKYHHREVIDLFHCPVIWLERYIYCIWQHLKSINFLQVSWRSKNDFILINISSNPNWGNGSRWWWWIKTRKHRQLWRWVCSLMLLTFGSFEMVGLIIKYILLFSIPPENYRGQVLSHMPEFQQQAVLKVVEEVRLCCDPLPEYSMCGIS